MQRETDELRAAAEDAQGGLEAWQERAATAEEAEVAAANRVQELEDELTRCGMASLSPCSPSERPHPFEPLPVLFPFTLIDL